MKAQNQLPEVTTNEIVEKIYVVRGLKVMLDRDLAEMYGVETKRLKEAVRRNISRFPDDFMFELSELELNNLRSQFATSSWGGLRYLPMAFTEQGVAMLSSVLRSERAIQVNIQIVRVYTKMRQLILDNKELWLKIEKIEQALAKKDDEVQAIFKVLKNLLVKEEKPRQPIGFKIPGKK
ncbi:ORF6N domain-containing protein [Agriterribacter sp.]|uniref:ORF6N domain-containing protein n=1 Tax=Agriterribacter sp. TaxID=2821509 RepID=UPI002C2B6B66|nr:ORF6N domain-containing protein [Agriterribacter sp.]HTN07147.1 ORF6N domain-containing protein [Agriterribacter sp.]